MLLALYHAIVRRIVSAGFRAIGRGDHERVVRQFARDGVFAFAGDHAMGGELRGGAAIGLWFERVHRLFPDLQLVPERIIVNGWPWSTTVATRFRVSATTPDGHAYMNDGMQYLRIAFGRIMEDRLYEDTDRLRVALQTLAEHGNAEALAAPLGR